MVVRRTSNEVGFQPPPEAERPNFTPIAGEIFIAGAPSRQVENAKKRQRFS